MKAHDSIEYFIVNGRDVMVRSFGNNPEAAQEWIKNCVPADKCNNLKIMTKTTTYQEVPIHD